MKSEKFRVIALVVIATLIRIYNLSKEVFRVDEASYIEVIFWESNLPNIISTAKDSWFHPPSYFVLYHYWGKIFGISQNALIALSIIFGVVSIILVYYIVKKLFKSRDIAFVSALLMCFNPYHFHFSRDATEYSLFVMLVFLSILTFINFLESKPENRLRNTILYILATALLYYTHNYAFIIILVQNISFVVYLLIKKSNLKHWIIIQLILLILIAPQLGHTYQNSQHEDIKAEIHKSITASDYWNKFKEQTSQISSNNKGELDNSRHPNAFLNRGMLRIINWVLCIIMIAGILLSVFIVKPKRKVKKEKSKRIIRVNKDNLFGVVFLLILFFTPLVLTAYFPDVFCPKCLLFTALAYTSLLSLGIIYLFRNNKLRIIVILIIILFSIVSINYSLENKRFFIDDADWKGAVEFVKKPENHAELVVLHVAWDTRPFLYYYDIDETRGAHVDFKGEGYLAVCTPSKGVIGDSYLDTGWYESCYKGLNKSLRNINDFWLVSSQHSRAYIYPDKPIFNLIEQNFKNISEHHFGSVEVIRYRKE